MRINSITSGKIFKASRYVPAFDKGVFMVKIMSSNEFMLGIVATKRIGGAVQRNYAKRRIRNAFIQTIGDFRPKCATIIIAKPELSKVNFSVIIDACKELKNILRRRSGSPD